MTCIVGKLAEVGGQHALAARTSHMNTMNLDAVQIPGAPTTSDMTISRSRCAAASHLVFGLHYHTILALHLAAACAAA